MKIKVKRYVAMLAAAAVLAGCASSPPAQFYTLNTVQDKAVRLQTAAPVYIEMLPVNMPVSLARPQIVLREGDMRLDIRENQRWGAAFNEEMRSVLASQIAEQLGATDVTYVGVSPDKDTYRISVDVQQFDVIKGHEIRGSAAWTINRIHQGEPQTCRVVIHQPVGETMSAMVQGMQQATALISSSIASGIVQQQKYGKVHCAAQQNVK